MAGPSGVGSLTGANSKPMNVEQIVQHARNYDYNPQIPLRYWLRSANTLLKEAEIYESEGNDQQTYLLLFRHAQLVLSQLSQHPDVGPQYKASLAQAERDVKGGLAKMEVLQPRINKKYERHQRMLRERAAMGMEAPTRRKQSTLSSPQPQRSNSDLDWRTGTIAELDGQPAGAPPDPSIAGAETLAAGENKDLAVELARKEIRRRAAARKATLRAGISEEVEQERRTAGVWGSWETDFASNHAEVDGDALSRQMQNIWLQVDNRKEGQGAKQESRPSYKPSPRSSFNYPTVQSFKGVPADDIDSPWNSFKVRRPTGEPLGFVASLDRPPPPPPKDELYPTTTSAPPRPAKQPLSSPTTTIATRPPPPPPRPTTDLKPSGFTFQPAAYLENGTPLRTVFLPPDLRQRFLALAEPNTRANLETCGILCGTLISNALFISRLVIPEQISTSDTCETKNEEALFDYVDHEDLMVLGWIHTHPTQTCFMSSRDLHTHAGYQAMMAESFAIVCAPSKPPQTWGVFRLTDPPGLQSVLKCTQKGLFHPHEETHMYTEALRPGHVVEAKGLEYEIHDMRKD